MKKVRLYEEFIIGHSVIDNQHARLITRINQMILKHDNSDFSGFLERFDLFLSELLTHFHEEEEIMQTLGFVEQEGHHVHHEYSLASIIKIKDDLITSRDMNICLHDVTDLLMGNILRHDLGFRSYLEAINYEDDKSL